MKIKKKELEFGEMVEYVTGYPGTDMYPTCSYQLPVRDVDTRVGSGGLAQIAALVAEIMGHTPENKSE